MNDRQTQHYLEAIETLLRQWDDVMMTTTAAIERQHRGLLPAIRIRQLGGQLLNRTPPPSCTRLYADLTSMINTHTTLLYAAFTARDDIASAYREYEEAVITTHAEVIRMRARYQLET